MYVPSKELLMRLMSLTLALAIGALGACSDSTDLDDEDDQARIRVVHASPDAPNVDVLIDGAQVVTNAAFTESSSYLDVDAGSRVLRVEAVGTNTAAITTTLNAVGATDYTVIAANRLASIEPLVLTDDNTAPTAGNIKLRVVHGAPGAPNVDVYITAPTADLATATANFSNVAFRGFSPYASVPAGAYRVRVTTAGTRTVVIDSGTLTLTTGQIRTAIARDITGGGAPFGLILLSDLN